MNYQSMSNSAIAAELGNRLERLRLEQNMTQQVLANEIGITAKSYRQLVAGGGKLENMIAALRALNALDQLDSFLPAAPPSPLEQLKMRGKQRQRARNHVRASSGHQLERQDLAPDSANTEQLDW
jgi:transcriptional regulator with XRE-family HTH domain